MIAEEEKVNGAGDIINLVKSYAAKLEREEQGNSLDESILSVREQASGGLDELRINQGAGALAARPDAVPLAEFNKPHNTESSTVPQVESTASQQDGRMNEQQQNSQAEFNIDTSQACGTVENVVDLLQGVDRFNHFGSTNNIHLGAGKSEFHINDFLAYQGEDFVRHAYFALLHRNPDAGGLENYVNKLKNGKLSKILILAGLRLSKEGRRKKVRLNGLFFPLGR
ncbi:MAG: hypothetical protein ACI8WB_005983, partial [Phenylobacterium sp.]